MRVFGTVDQKSLVMMTTNFALTYYSVASDIESGKVSGFLIVVDTEGIAVDSAVVARKLTAENAAEAIKESGVERKLKHRRLIILGKATKVASQRGKTIQPIYITPALEGKKICFLIGFRCHRSRIESFLSINRDC